MKRICIVGGGFAGLEALRQFQETLERRRNVRVTLIDPNPAFVYTPLLPQVAAGDLSSRAVELKLSEVVRGQRVTLVRDRAEGLDLDRRQVICQGQRVDFDHVLLCPGAAVNRDGLDDPRGLAMSWKTAADAAAVSRRVLEVFARARTTPPEALRRRLTFVIAGGGCTGVELAASLSSNITRALLPRVGGELQRHCRIIIVEPQGELLPSFTAEARRVARQALDDLGVELILGDRVVGFDGSEVALGSGDALEAETLLWAAGVRAPEWLAQADVPLADDGRILVEDSLEVVDRDGVFAVGDATVRQRGIPWPRLAQVASRQGPLAADNILMDMVGASTHPFEYSHLGSLVQLGHQNAMFVLGEQVVSGPTAWALSQAVHLGLAPTLSRKLAILAEWAQNAIEGQEWARLPLLDA